jgi:hypothetical protein
LPLLPAAASSEMPQLLLNMSGPAPGIRLLQRSKLRRRLDAREQLLLCACCLWVQKSTDRRGSGVNCSSSSEMKQTAGKAVVVVSRLELAGGRTAGMQEGSGTRNARCRELTSAFADGTGLGPSSPSSPCCCLCLVPTSMDSRGSRLRRGLQLLRRRCLLLLPSAGTDRSALKGGSASLIVGLAADSAVVPSACVCCCWLPAACCCFWTSDEQPAADLIAPVACCLSLHGALLLLPVVSSRSRRKRHSRQPGPVSSCPVIESNPLN